MFKSGSLIAFFVCSAFLICTSLYQQKQYKWGGYNEITWDAAGYYLYLPSVFYDHLSTLDKKQYLIDNYHPWANGIEAHPSPTGKYVIKYSSGQAFMSLPGFIVAHFWAKFAGYPCDGFSKPYQICMALYSVLFCCIGLWFIRKVLLVYFEDVLVTYALIVLCFGTNYLNYSTFSNMMTHGYLFTVYSVIIYLSISWLNSTGYLKAIFLGLLVGLMALTRPTEIISVLIPLFWGVANRRELQVRIKKLAVQWQKVLLLFVCAFCVGSVQLIYWKAMTGHFLYWSYDDPNDGFNFLKLHAGSGMFSYEKGWFVYTPVMILSVIGLIPLYRNRRALFWPVTVFSFIALYIVFSWKNWAYGGSFSMRAVVQYYAVLIFPVTAFFEWVRMSLIATVICFMFCAACIYLNLVMTAQANLWGEMETKDMTKEYYWAIFGRPFVPIETKKLIYTDEVLPENLEPTLHTIYTTDTLGQSACLHDTISEGKKLFVYGGSRSIISGAHLAVSNIHSGWFRVNTLVAMKQREDDYWKEPCMYAALVNPNGEQIKFKSYHIERLLTSDSLTRMFIDIKVPEGETIKEVRGGVRIGCNKMIFVGPLWMEYTPGTLK